MKEKNNNKNKQIKWSEVFKYISIFVAVIGVIFIIISTVKGHGIEGTSDYTLIYLFGSTVISTVVFVLFLGMHKAFICIEEMQRQLITMSQKLREYDEKNNISGYWWCICGKRNAEYIGTCACGKRKSK